jgi:hypothetical protein
MEIRDDENLKEGLEVRPGGTYLKSQLLGRLTWVENKLEAA